jgi:hypothetical protein
MLNKFDTSTVPPSLVHVSAKLLPWFEKGMMWGKKAKKQQKGNCKKAFLAMTPHCFTTFTVVIVKQPFYSSTKKTRQSICIEVRKISSADDCTPSPLTLPLKTEDAEKKKKHIPYCRTILHDFDFATLPVLW